MEEATIPHLEIDRNELIVTEIDNSCALSLGYGIYLAFILSFCQDAHICQSKDLLVK